MWDGATVIGSVSKTKPRHNIVFVFFFSNPGGYVKTYTERRRLAPEYKESNTHTHQRTHLTIVTIIIERESVATAILYYIFLRTSSGGGGMLPYFFLFFSLFSRPSAGLTTV